MCLCYSHNMAEKKAVLNVTVSESVADTIRMMAQSEGTTISSVVERALAEQVFWDRKRAEGLAAIDAYYQEHGYPTAEEMAEAEARVIEEERLIDEARAALAAQRTSRRGAQHGDAQAGQPHRPKKNPAKKSPAKQDSAKDSGVA